MNKVKYVRCSTTEQNTERQEVNANNFFKVYIDRCSGTIDLKDRKEGKRMLKDIEAGIINEVHVASVDRLGRSILDILTTVQWFSDRNINLYVENIGSYSMIDGKPNGTFKMIISVLGNVAEMERTNMLERQRQGIEIAKAKGKYTGRLYGTHMTKEQLLQKYKTVAKELKEGQSLRRAAKLGECSLATAQRVQKVLLEAA
jgi:DNA invertase Pin-like site-specific DNA recombinase